jgi:hypothetical protein
VDFISVDGLVAAVRSWIEASGQCDQAGREQAIK